MDYTQALAQAIEAARVAGEILRADWHLPEGPRGGGSKAPADTEAEWEIRRRLRAAFPQWRYVGEETGTEDGAADDPHTWLVDPNDGTRPYLAGFRGSAVSIGLLRDGVPVLGVVYAFAAPDDDGDLIDWAENCGPLRRNGQPLGVRVWPETLGPYDVVLLSQVADRKPLAFADMIEPARFRTVPSIAYRLALVAAGDGVMTLSLNGPGDYDYGAGHALLRGAGGALVDAEGQPVVYTRDGKSRTRYCFGGAPRVVTAIARKPWADVYNAETLHGLDFRLTRPVPGSNVSTAERLRRAQGTWFGQLTGDALGSQVEFQPPEVIARMYPGGLRTMQDGGTFNTLSGQPTDDSEMAIALARSLIQHGDYSDEAAAQAYAGWLATGPFDIGLTVGAALGSIAPADIQQGRAADKSRQWARPDSQANGALMRISPLGIWGHALDPDVLARYATADALLTHPHPVCQEASTVFVLSIAYAIRKCATPAQVYEFAADWVKNRAREESIRKAVSDARHGPPAEYRKQQGWVLIALQNAYYQLLHAPSLEHALVDTVMQAGDTDTNAAIAGALLGAAWGREAVPFSWRQHVLSCRPITGLARFRRARPQFLWPVDALDLAERLLYCGAGLPQR